MRLMLLLLVGPLAACGARVLEVKTEHGGFCFMCADQPRGLEALTAPKGAR